MYLWSSVNNLQGRVSFVFPPCGTGDRTQSVRLGSKGLDPIGPRLLFLFWIFCRSFDENASVFLLLEIVELLLDCSKATSLEAMSDQHRPAGLQ